MVQSFFRKALLEIYNSKCAFCRFPHATALEACHIVPWSNCNDEEKISINNGILLCSNHHKLFDAGILRITENYIVEATVPFKSKIIGKKIKLPKSRRHLPDPTFIKKREKLFTSN